MGSEIEVTETPNWLQELEAKREKRLKARLAHESGAGAPCLKCGDKCPGLDLHFWRKCCKICKCPKEEHEVQDDDIYGWAQFQLLGSKPNKIKTKIVLPGKKDEVELDWTPKGHKETVDKYLKTLPPDLLPVKGSQAAQDRKQLLQKQIPIHDIDPTLCHELTEDELKKMNDYVAHVKQASVGIGQLVSLSSIIKGNLHKLNPNEAAIIASRYAKGVPLSEIVKLQSQSRSGSLKPQNLAPGMEKLNLNEPHKSALPRYSPNSLNATEHNLNPVIGNKMHDVNYPGYARDANQSLLNAQFASGLKSGQYRGVPCSNQSSFDPTIDEQLLQGTNFDPKTIPSHFLSQKSGQPNTPYNENLPGYKSGDISGQPNSAFVPYTKITSFSKPGESYIDENRPRDANYTSSLSGRDRNTPSIGQNMPYIDENHPNYATILPIHGQNFPRPGHNYSDDLNPQHPNYAQNLRNMSPGFGSGQSGGHVGPSSVNTGSGSNVIYENVKEMKKRDPQGLPNYAPGKFNVHSEVQSPTKLPKNVKDLAFSTYDQYSDSESGDPAQNLSPGSESRPVVNATSPGRPPLPNDYKPNTSSDIAKSYPGGPQNPMYGNNLSSNIPYVPYENYPSGLGAGNAGDLANEKDATYNRNLPGRQPNNIPYNSSALESGNQGNAEGAPYNENRSGHLPNVPYENYPTGLGSGNLGGRGNPANVPHGNSPVKKLSELHPGKININEDFLHPSQVNIGAIQDINYPEIKAATHGTNDFYEDYSPESLKEILNNVILPDCHYCKKPFEENEFAITIDRANVLFHANCFKCAGCNQILADNVYFYNKETDNVYCGRDYAKIRGFPRCKACDELIFTKEYCLAENSTFHLKHFCCIECDTPLAGQDYTLEDEMPYCLPCFEQSKASKCNSCCRVIKPDEMGCNLNGVHFHATDDCFACKICKNPLMGKKLLLRNEKLYCSHDCFGVDNK